MKANLRGNTRQREDVQVRRAPITVMARGTLSTSEKSSLTYEVTLGDLAPLQRYVGVPLQAKGSLKGTVQGTWPALQARSQLQLREWGYRELHGQRVQAVSRCRNPHCPPGDGRKPRLLMSRDRHCPVARRRSRLPIRRHKGRQMNVTAGPY